MTALNALLPQIEASTTDAMNTTVAMFAIMTGKTITAEEGYKFLTLWGMVAKTDASVPAMIPPAPVVQQAPQVPAVPAPGSQEVTAPVTEVHASPSAPASLAVSAPCKPSVVSEPSVVPVNNVSHQEPERMSMPPVEEIEIPGIEQPLRRLPESFRNNARYWVTGYNWKIMVEPFDANGEMEAYYVHFRNKPTPEEFAEHYAHFTATENRCRVHVMESDGQSSKRITDEYCSFREDGSLNFGTRETLNPNEQWEENARFRAVFFDKRLGGQKNYIYYANKPTKAQIDKISFAKGVVIVEPRDLPEND